MTGSPHQGIETMMHPGSDLAVSSKVYLVLHGVPPQAGEPFYAGYGATGQHIGLVPGSSSQDMTQAVAHGRMSAIEAKLAERTAAGATVMEPEHDFGAGYYSPLVPHRAAPQPQAPRGLDEVLDCQLIHNGRWLIESRRRAWSDGETNQG